MSDLNEIERGQLCQSTIDSLYDVTSGLRHFPGLLKKIIEHRAWERRVTRGKVIELSSLRELITEKPVRGWGEDPKKVEAVIKDDPEVLALWRAEMVGEKHKHKPKGDGDTDNVSIKPEAGNSKSYTLDRLKRESPELFREVCDGKLSANAAAIKAGFRKVKSPEDKTLDAFRKCENRLTVLHRVIECLEPHEIQVVRGWLQERS